MSKSAFSHDIRLLVCGHCGAPHEAPGSGGHAKCTYCDAVSEVSARAEPPIAPAEREKLSETERMAELRKQDGTPLRPPGTLPMSLMVWHGGDDTKKYEQAKEVWQASREALASGKPGKDDEEHLYFLTLAMANYYSKQKDLESQRAVLETAAELVEKPRYRQVLRCMMARYAARDGDMRAAEEWLAPCDPEPTDLYMDTAYRFTKAFIASRSEDWATVLALLGRDQKEIPTADFLDHLATLYRAHALEKTGDVDAATSALAEAMRTTRGTPRSFVEIAEAAGVELCPESLPAAYEPQIRKWKIRHAVFLTVWVALLNWFAADWLMDIGSLSPGVRHWWPLPPLLLVGWILNIRWRP